MFPVEMIEAGPVTLRHPEERDADAIARACADPEMVRVLPGLPHPYGRDDAMAWITEHAPETWKTGGAAFVIADKETGQALGTIALQPPDRFGESEIGYWVAPWAQGKGVATAVVRALSDWAFAHGLGRIGLFTNVENVASQLVAYRSGFTREGVLRGGQPQRDGSRADLTAFGRLATDPGDPFTAYLPFFPGGFPGGELTDGVVRLTPLSAADIDDYHAMMSDPAIYQASVPPEPEERADAAKRCRHNGTRWLAAQAAEFALRPAGAADFAGHLQFSHLIPGLDQAMLGYSLLPRYQGAGLMTRAVNLLMEWTFQSTPIRRVIAGTATWNTASQRVLERTGFTREFLVKGLLPGPDGTRVDDLQWSRHRP
jgi:RimJ/RimL family protein N-acetyltransferase